MRDFSVQEPEQQLQRVRAEEQQRDGSYRMPANHWHPYFELYYLESGSCRFFLADRMLDVHGGDLLLIPPRTLHYTRYLFGPCRRCNLFFRWQDLEGRVRATFPEQDQFFRAWRLMQIPDFYREHISALFARMVGEERIGDERTALLMHYRLQEMLLLCGRTGLQRESVPEDIHTTDRAIVRAAEYMREHFRERVSAEEIAGAAGFSPNYLSRRFRQATGMGVHEYLGYLRLQQAALELTETKDSVTDIALRCGFSDGNYFKDCFKRRYGCGPRAYRSGQGEGSDPG